MLINTRRVYSETVTKVYIGVELNRISNYFWYRCWSQLNAITENVISPELLESNLIDINPPPERIHLPEKHLC